MDNINPNNERRPHVTAHLPKPVVWVGSLVITMIFSCIGAMFYLLLDESKINSSQDERIDGIISALERNTEKLQTPTFTRSDYLMAVQPVISRVDRNENNLESLMKSFTEQNNEVKNSLNKIAGDIGELKGYIKSM